MQALAAAEEEEEGQEAHMQVFATEVAEPAAVVVEQTSDVLAPQPAPPVMPVQVPLQVPVYHQQPAVPQQFIVSNNQVFMAAAPGMPATPLIVQVCRFIFIYLG
jgi:hypothetical protein